MVQQFGNLFPSIYTSIWGHNYILCNAMGISRSINCLSFFLCIVLRITMKFLLGDSCYTNENIFECFSSNSIMLVPVTSKH